MTIKKYSIYDRWQYKKEVTLKYRRHGLKLIGGSVVFIAFLALFLVVLSIQRNVKMLREEGGIR